MDFSIPLMSGTLKKRYKRFLADITLDDGQEITAHCANSGAMYGIKDPGLKVWVSEVPPESKGKLKYKWELVEADGTIIGCHTSHPNGIVADAIRDGKIPSLNGYDLLKREVKYGQNSRVDIFLSKPGWADCYVEVKNVHMVREPGVAEFPDAVTARGAKHMKELADMARKGKRAVIVYLIQRQDVTRFKLAGDIDPDYRKATKAALKAGVEALAYRCSVSPQRIEIDQEVMVDIS